MKILFGKIEKLRVHIGFLRADLVDNTRKKAGCHIKEMAFVRDIQIYGHLMDDIGLENEDLIRLQSEYLIFNKVFPVAGNQKINFPILVVMRKSHTTGIIYIPLIKSEIVAQFVNMVVFRKVLHTVLTSLRWDYTIAAGNMQAKEIIKNVKKWTFGKKEEENGTKVQKI